MKTIEITIAADGKSKVETKGFAGTVMSRRQSISRSVTWNAENRNADQRVLRNQFTNPTGEQIDNIADSVRLLFVVEGTNDIEFLRRISADASRGQRVSYRILRRWNGTAN